MPRPGLHDLYPRVIRGGSCPLMRFTTVRTITTMLAAVTLLASACGDDDGSETERRRRRRPPHPRRRPIPCRRSRKTLRTARSCSGASTPGRARPPCSRWRATARRSLDSPAPGRPRRQPAQLVADGRQIAFMREFPDRAGEVHVVDADGAGDHPVDPGCPAGIPDSQACVEQQPAWSPDGRQIAFSHPYGEITSDGIDVVAISVMDPDGGNLEQLTQHDQPTSAEDLTPVWSPDGHQIAFMRENTWADPLGQTAIFVMQADGTGAQRVTPWDLRAADPDWSPDGQSISFRSEPTRARTSWATSTQSLPTGATSSG